MTGYWAAAIALTTAIALALQARQGAGAPRSLAERTLPRVERRVGVDGIAEIRVQEPTEPPRGPGRISTARRVAQEIGRQGPPYLGRLGLPLRIGPFSYIYRYGWQNGLLWVDARTNNLTLAMGLDTNGRGAELLYAPKDMSLGTRGLLANGDIIVATSSPQLPVQLWLLPQDPTFGPFRLPGEAFRIAPNGERVLLFRYPGRTLLFDADTRSVTPLVEVPRLPWPVWGSDVRADWLADSRTVLIMRETGRPFQAALVDVLTDRVVRVWSRADASAVAEASPDGRYVAITWVAPEDELWGEESSFPDPIGREVEFFDLPSGRSWTFRSEDDPRVSFPLQWASDGAWLVTGAPIEDPHEGHPPPSGPYRVWRVGFDGTQRSFEAVDRLLGFKDVRGVSPSTGKAAIKVWRGRWWDLLILDPGPAQVTRWLDTWFVRWLPDDQLLLGLPPASPPANREPRPYTIVTREGARIGQIDYRTTFSPDFSAIATETSGPKFHTGHAWVKYVEVTPNPMR